MLELIQLSPHQDELESIPSHRPPSLEVGDICHETSFAIEMYLNGCSYALQSVFIGIISPTVKASDLVVEKRPKLTSLLLIFLQYIINERYCTPLLPIYIAKDSFQRVKTSHSFIPPFTACK